MRSIFEQAGLKINIHCHQKNDMSLLNMPNRAETDNNLSPIFALRGLISVIVVRVFVLDFLKRDIVLCVVSCGCECSVNLIKD